MIQILIHSRLPTLAVTKLESLQTMKPKVSKTRLFVNFVAISLGVFVSQIPSCAIACADDAGLIDYEKNETLIEFSKYLFAYPLWLFVSTSKGLGWLLAVYLGNILYHLDNEIRDARLAGMPASISFQPI